MIPLRDRNPSGSFPLVTVLIIAGNTLVFFYELAAGDRIQAIFNAYALVPRQISVGLVTGTLGLAQAAFPFFTSMFLHGGWLHLIGNMWFLWIFGDNVEDTLGPIRYLIFYLVCGFAAGLTQYFLAPESSVPTVGASGAISGVLAAYATLFPQARVLTLVPLGFFLQVMELPALALILLWFGLQALNAFLSMGMTEGAGVAWGAHVGGFLAGLILVRVLRPRRVMA